MSFFETKNALFGYFWTGILKTYRHILNQHPRVCLIAKFCAKIKNFKMWNQKRVSGSNFENVLFAHFWACIL